MGTATPERGKGEEVGIDLRGDWTWEEGRDLRHSPSPGAEDSHDGLSRCLVTQGSVPTWRAQLLFA